MFHNWSKDQPPFKIALSVYSGLYFDDEKDAAKRYNEEAVKIHGEFANLNNL